MGVVPYHILTVCGDVIFAARGSHIDSLNTSLERISTWKHPLKEGGAGQDISSPAPAPAADGPPAKRRKVDAEDGQEQEAESAAAAKNGQEGKETGGGWEKPSNERPFIQGLVTTTDGRHVVAITGSDKTIWVLEHDGKGNLKQLSQRMMPKRPCSITLTSDNSTILSADKFGDVFSLPLIPTAQPQAQQPSENATRSRSSSVAPTPQPFKPQANELTVHTKRNLRALEHQKLAMQQQKAAAEKAAEARNFEHTLLLGHVSMLTAILSATTVTPSGSRREYVITADRDEHIRITRGIPQTHVIEGFCLGHEDFISRLCIPSSRPEVLISGGGDDDLFVWDWVNAKLLSKTNLLTHVQAVSGEGAEVSKVAVSRLYSFTHGGSTWVVVVCERVPALICYQLQDTTLTHRQTIQTAGNALDAVYIIPGGDGEGGRLLVTCDPNTENKEGCLVVYKWDSATTSAWTPNSSSSSSSSSKALPPGGDDDGQDVSAEELQKLLYTTETLRKTTDFD